MLEGSQHMRGGWCVFDQIVPPYYRTSLSQGPNTFRRLDQDVIE